MSLNEYFQLNTHSFRYVIPGWSMHDDAPGPLLGLSLIRASDKALDPKPSFGGRAYARGTGLLVRGALPRMSSSEMQGSNLQVQ